MITCCWITFCASGPGFDPGAHAIPWTDEGNADHASWGEISMKLSSFSQQQDAIKDLHGLLNEQLPALRESGAEDFDLSITWAYEKQCAGGFTKEELQWIAELGCTVSIDCTRA